MSYPYLGVPVTGLRMRIVDDCNPLEGTGKTQKRWEYEVDWTWLTEDALSANPYPVSALGTDTSLCLDADNELP